MHWIAPPKRTPPLEEKTWSISLAIVMSTLLRQDVRATDGAQLSEPDPWQMA